MPLFSFIIPTRGRVGGLRLLLDSLRENAQDPACFEVIVVVDDDDRESQSFSYTGVQLERVVVPRGQTMGNLNLAGYRAASGRYLMLLNDDVVVRTPGWDAHLRRVLERYPDGMVLVHVNDLIFHDTLCTFPLLTREFCQMAGGICRSEYRRYRIDDHIHHVFDLIHVLGYTRRIYLPDVVFEHGNVATDSSGLPVYVPNPEIQEQDTRDFEALIGERRLLALQCVERIEGRAREEVRAGRARHLEECTDSIALRRREHARVWRRADHPLRDGSVTIAVVAESAHAARGCLQALSAALEDLPVMVVPQRNDALAVCRSDYLILLEPDLRVAPGWWEGLSSVLAEGPGIIAGKGLLLIDVARCGHLRFEEEGAGESANALRAYLERARAEGIAIADWPAGPAPATSPLAPVQAPPRPPAVDLPFPARAAYWSWGALARAAAHWPALIRFGIGIPPVLLDEEWYLTRYPDVAAKDAGPLLHYLREGAALGYKPNPHFDTSWYLASHPDVAASGLNPLVHFVRYGAREGRNPNLFFDIHYYSKQNPEVAAKGLNPLQHFLSTPPAERRSPNASLKLAQYLRRLESTPLPSRITVSVPAPLSIVIPTRNRGEKLMRTLDACRRHAGGCDLEFVIVDDGSTDSTPALLQARSRAEPNLSWHSLRPAGPGSARNFAAAHARHSVLLFMGDDILPANDEFFRVHARHHAEHPERDFAVLGRVRWPEDAAFPVSYTMAHILQDGSQFAFSRLTPGGFASWQYFYTSNVSVKKSLVRDWMADGFDTGFPGAAIEDTELAYRLWQSETGLRLYYDPASVGLHEHAYRLGEFLNRQFFVGQSLRHLLQLHPELLDEYGLRQVAGALREPRGPRDATLLDDATSTIERLEDFGRLLEEQDQLGSETWHAALLSALFELRMHNGYASAWPAGEVNLAAARVAMLDRFFDRIPRLRNLPNLSRLVR